MTAAFHSGIALSSFGPVTPEALRPRPDPAPTHTLKYFASGWWNTNASVDCSGCSISSSLRTTPIRSGRSSSVTLRRSSMSGHAG